ncbi:putative IclR-family regulatory protein [Rhodococcoides trifolii]|uniref:IclR-family regulatory protein n=1 Tax=Rhodococcoides trifolii TaxID=908250 RepID=A0A917G083_9NOCA|nr:IclR family transcriptional regulator [Rhodococcus trifolii]GGG16021.1 putative IclR-family regulatory protein [Rhodococcus trifolii]
MSEESSTVIGRVSTLLRAVGSSEPGGSSTTSLARATGLARPTAHRLLAALAAEGFVDRDGASGRWFLGPEIYLLGSMSSARYDVTDHARDIVRALAADSGESAFLSARRGDETVCLLREDGSFPLRSHVLHEGIRFPLGVASAGLVILAHLPDAELDAYLAGTDLVTQWGVSHSNEAVQQRVQAVRREGYAVNPGLLVEGSWGMGAAVFDRAGRPAWALSLTGVETRFRAERRPELGRLLLEQAHVLTKTLGRRN